MRIRTVLLALAIVACPASSQEEPDVRELLRASGEAMQKLRSYEMENNTVTETQMVGMPNKMEESSSTAVAKPDRSRWENGRMLIISDGEHTWTYHKALKQYTKKPAIIDPATLAQRQGSWMTDLEKKEKSGELYKSAKILREETIETPAGKKADCYVVEWVLDKMPLFNQGEMTDAVNTLWIDKATSVLWRQSSRVSASIKIDPMPQPVQINVVTTTSLTEVDLPPLLFAFTPPPDAKEVDAFGSGMNRADLTGKPLANSDLTGKPAVDFKLAALDGKQYDLEALRGKVVLLDFWATWCGPCRADIPALERLHQEFQGNGLVVLGMNVGEERKTVEEFLKNAKASYPMLLTAETQTPAAYQVWAYPTVVVVDRQGKIVSYKVGSGGEAGLRSALEKAGMVAAKASQ